VGVIEVVQEMLGALLQAAAAACVVELLRRFRDGSDDGC
jgi:hypothetical protein